MKDLKNGKAVGVDGIPEEFWKNMGDEGTSELVDIYKRIYEEYVWPAEFIVIVSIPKKMKAYGECRPISLKTRASKILVY